MNKRTSEKKIICLLFTLYAAVGFIVMFAFKTVLPFPFAELSAIAYYCFSEEKILLGILLFILIGAALYFLTEVLYKKDISVIGKVYITVLCSFDFIIHLFVFFVSEGLQWNYMISAVFDFVLAVVSLIKINKTTNNTDITD